MDNEQAGTIRWVTGCVSLALVCMVFFASRCSSDRLADCRYDLAVARKVLQARTAGK